MRRLWFPETGLTVALVLSACVVLAVFAFMLPLSAFSSYIRWLARKMQCDGRLFFAP